MFQVGFSLMNLTAILLPQDRCSMPAECFMDEHCFCKRDLFPSQFLLYIHTPTLFIWPFSKLLTPCGFNRFFFFFQRQGSSFFLKHRISGPAPHLREGGEERKGSNSRSSWQIRTRNVVNQLISIEQYLLNTLVHHDLVQSWLDQMCKYVRCRCCSRAGGCEDKWANLTLKLWELAEA